MLKHVNIPNLIITKRFEEVLDVLGYVEISPRVIIFKHPSSAQTFGGASKSAQVVVIKPPLLLKF